TVAAEVILAIVFSAADCVSVPVEAAAVILPIAFIAADCVMAPTAAAALILSIALSAAESVTGSIVAALVSVRALTPPAGLNDMPPVIVRVFVASLNVTSA